MNLRKSHLAAAVGAALLVGGTAAQAQVTSAQPGIAVQLYGQVSRAVMHADDGHSSKWFHVDGQPSSTRFGINASGQASPGLRVGARIEAEMKSNPSDTVSFATPQVTNTFVERWLDAFVEGSWGRVNMGQGSNAADDASTLDLSGTNMPNGTCPTDWGGGILFRTGAGGTGPSLGTGLGNCNDFESRHDRLMYTTPTFGGFRAQVGQGQRTVGGESTEASVWYSGKLAGDFQAAIGYSTVNNSAPSAAGTTPDRETIGGSVAWLHTSGFNVAFAMTSVDGISGSATDDRKGKHQWFKVGYKFGQHAVALDFGIYDDQSARDDEGTSIGLGYVFNPVRWAELYAGYHVFSLDRPGVDFEDITVFALGTRVRF
jgi:Gram-negative porin